MNIDVICDIPCVCGEGPIWHVAEQCLYFTDIPRGRLYRFDPATGQTDLVHEGRLLGGIVIHADGSLLLLRDKGNIARWRNGKVTDVIREIPGESNFNDGIAGPNGRVFSGTVPVEKRDSPGEFEHLGRLYRFDVDGSYEIIRHGISCTNGLGFSVDQRTLYWTDSNTYCIHAYDYDPETGAVSNPRLFRRTKPPKKPDGMTVDSANHVWSAQWEGARVVRYSLTGEKVTQVKFPTAQVTSCCFGGADLDELYVTSAGGDRRDETGPYAGCLFRVTGLGVRGRAEYLARL